MSEEATLDEYTDTEYSNERVETPIGELPADWDVEWLEDVTQINPDGFSEEDWASETFEYISLSEVSEGEIKQSETVPVEEAPSRAQRRVQAGDILVGTVRPKQVSHGFVTGEHDGKICSSGFGVLRAGPNLNSHYLMQEVLSHRFFAQMDAYVAGSGYPAVKVGDLKKHRVSIPLLEEQRKIATVLYTADQAIQKTEEIISQVETVRTGFVRGLYDSDQLAERDGRSSSEEQRFESISESRREVWAEAEEERQRRRGDFDESIDESSYSPPLDVATQRLPELPEGWLWTSLDAFVAYDIDYRGRTPPYSDSGISVISSGNIQDGEIVFEDEKYVSEETYDEWLDRGVPREGDLLITTEAPVGKVTLYPEGTYLPTRRIITFRTVGVENRYLQAAIRHPYVQNYLTAQSGGSTVGRILKDHLLKTPIPLPPKEEQKQIADTLKGFDQRIANESEYKSRLQRLKQGLMQDLLSGIVRATDTNIEVPEEIAQHG